MKNSYTFTEDNHDLSLTEQDYLFEKYVEEMADLLVIEELKKNPALDVSKFHSDKSHNIRNMCHDAPPAIEINWKEIARIRKTS
jgi:hypothetical protein